MAQNQSLAKQAGRSSKFNPRHFQSRVVVHMLVPIKLTVLGWLSFDLQGLSLNNAHSSYDQESVRRIA